MTQELILPERMRRKNLVKGPTLSSDDIIDIFRQESSPLMALTKMQDFSLSWLVSKLFINQNNAPLQLLPFQSVILEDVLWEKKFPILMMCRGAGKSWILGLYSILRALLNPGSQITIVGASFRQSKFVFGYLDRLYRQSPIIQEAVTGGKKRGKGPRIQSDTAICEVGPLSVVKALPVGDGCLTSDTQILFDQYVGNINKFCYNIQITKTNHCIWGDGQFRITDESYNNGLQKTKRIITKRGYSIEGTYNHAIKILRDGKIEWCRFDQLKINDYVLIDRTERWHNGNFQCSEDQALTVGLFLGDGSYHDQYKLRYTTADPQLAQDAKRGLGRALKKTDELHYDLYCKKFIQQWRDFWGLKAVKTSYKEIPPNMLAASKEKMTKCLQGIFDTDGTVEVSEDKRGGGISIVVSLTNTSERLVEQVQFILLHYGIISTRSSRWREKGRYKIWELFIHGQDCKKFAELIGFNLKRKSNQLNNGLTLKKRNITNGDEVPFVKEIMINIAELNRIPKGKLCVSGVNKSKIQKRKVITRDFIDKFLKQYSFTNDSRLSVIKELANSNIFYDKVESIVDSEAETFDIHVPDNHEYCANGFFSHNSKIRGQRSTHILIDETASLAEEIVEHVISPFASVHADPERRVRITALCQRLEKLGADSRLIDEIKSTQGFGNQIVYAGTASYKFNHFYKRNKTYETIIKSKGDPDVIAKMLTDRAFEEGKQPENVEENARIIAKHWKNYAIVKIPYHAMPHDFLDEEQVSNNKASFSSVRFSMEYECKFAEDSEGFIKRSEIETATPNPVEYPIPIELYGDPKATYVLGLDPARWNDNFAAVVMKIMPGISVPVYCNAWVRTEFRTSVRNIREIIRRFNIRYIAMDKGGGGDHIADMLKLPELIDDSRTEFLVWPIPDQIEDKIELGKPGPNMLELVNFKSWIKEAAHALQADINYGRIQFTNCAEIDDICQQFERYLIRYQNPDQSPRLIQESDKKRLEEELFGATAGDLEKLSPGIFDHLVEMIDETCTIERMVTPGGDESFNLPKLTDQLEGLDIRRRDRFSAFVLAAYAARIYSYVGSNAPPSQNIAGTPNYIIKSGRTRKFKSRRKGQTFY